MNLFDLFVKIGLKDEASDKLSSLSKKLGNGLKTAAKIGTAAVGAASAAVVAFGTSAVNAGKDFDSSMSQVAATMGVTTDEITELRDFAQEMGSTTAFSASQAADALNYMALAGYDAQTSMSMLPNVLNLAAAGGIELAYASDMVTDAQSALGLSIEGATELVDKMAKASSKTNTSVQQLGEAILTVGGTAKNLKGGTTELAQALGLLADNGIKGSEGGTHLRNIMLAMTPTTDDAAAAFKKLNLQTYDSRGQLRSLEDIFLDLNKAMSGMTDEEKQNILTNIFNKTDLSSVNALLSTTKERWDEVYESINGAWYTTDGLTKAFKEIGANINYESFIKSFQEIGVSAEEVEAALNSASSHAGNFAESIWDFSDAGTTFEDVIKAMPADLEKMQIAFDATTGAAQAMADTQLDNLEGDITLFKSALEGAQIAISDKLTPSLRDFVQFGSNGLSELTEAFKADGLTGVMDTLGNLIGEGLSMMIEKLPQAIGAGASLVESLIQGISENKDLIINSAFAAVMTLADGILSMLPQIVTLGLDLIVSLANGITQNLGALIPTVVDVVLQLVNTITDPKTLINIIDAGIDIILALIDGVIDAIPELMRAVPQVVASIVTVIIAELPTIISAAIDIVFALIDGIIMAIPELVAAVPNLIIGIVHGLLNNLDKIILAAPQIIVSLVTGLIGAIPQLVMALPRVIMSIVETFRNYNWGSIGANIVSGIKNGISKMWGNLKTWFKNLFGDLIGVAKRILGIASPSKVFASLGEYSAEGYGIGFNRAFDRIKKDINGTLSFGTSSINLPTSTMSTSFGGGGAYRQTMFSGLTINVNGANIQNDESLAEMIAVKLEQMTLREGAVFA